MYITIRTKFKNLLSENRKTGLNFLAFGAIAIIVTILPHIGWQYYDRGSDQSFTAVFKGVFSNEHGHLSNNDGNWILIHYLLQFLYIFLPACDWYGIVMVMLTSLIIYAFGKIVWVATYNDHVSPNRIFLLLPYLVPATLLVDSVAVLEFTRVSILLTTTGILSITIGSVYQNADTSFIQLKRIGVVVFCLGCLVRIQGALLSSFLILPFLIFLMSKSNKSFKPIAKDFLTPLLFLIAATLFSSLKWNVDTDLVPKYAGYALSLNELDIPTSQLNLANEKDSIILQAIARSCFLNDPKHINVGFFERIGAPFIDKKLHSIPAMLKNGGNFKEKIIEQGGTNVIHLSYFLIGVFLLFVVYLALLPNAKKIPRGWIFFYILYVAALYVAISGLLKMERRVASPFFFTSILVMLLFMQASINNAISNTILKVSVFLAAIVTSCLGAISIRSYFNGLKNEASYYTEIVHYASTKKEKYVFLESIGYHVYNQPFQSEPLSNDKFYPLINSLFFVDPTYSNKMKLITNADDFEGYWKFVAANSKECLFVSAPDEIGTMIQYANTLYGLNLRFKSISKDLRLELHQNNPEALNPFYLYQVEEGSPGS